MEVLSITGEAIAVTALASQVTETCYRYRQYTDLADLEKLTVELKLSRQRLEGLFPLFGPHRGERQAFPSDFTALTATLTGSNGPLRILESEISDLQARIEGSKYKFTPKRWPLSAYETQRFTERIKICNHIFDRVLDPNQNESARLVELQVRRLGKFRSDEQTEDKKRKRLNDWIAAPDSSSTHKVARTTRQPSTGSWFVDGDMFNGWLSSPGFILWLHGPAGSGKTILCSFAIDKVLSFCESDWSLAAAYFYFNFQDERKRSLGGLMRSLVQQLSMNNNGRGSKELEKLFQNCQYGQREPSLHELQDTLNHLIHQMSDVYIIIDAIDECEEYEDTIEFLSDLEHSNNKNLHLMATSRPDILFRSSFDMRQEIMVSISENATSAKDDLMIYIIETLQNDAKLRRWSKDVLSEIETKLRNGGQGSFRWVECQLNSLRRCRRISDIRGVLTSLPKTIDETYERILGNVSEDMFNVAITLLQWLAYSSRPLRIEEIVDVLAIEDLGRPRLNPDHRLVDPQDVLTICPELVMVMKYEGSAEEGPPDGFEELQFAHFSVKEYLTSDRCSVGACAKFSIQPKAHNMIAEYCIGYLFSITVQNLLEDEFRTYFPLSQYASREWSYHVKKAQQQEDVDRLDQMINDLLSPSDSQVVKWLRMFDPDKPWSLSLNPHKTRREVCSELYYASSLGLLRTVKRLLKQGADVNQIGGSFGSALQAAAYRGHEEIVVTLIENGANCTIRCGHFGTALQAANFAHHESIVRILKEKDESEIVQGQLSSHIQLLQVEKEPFEVIDRIGCGGSGVVDKVRILSDGRICVRKTCQTPSPATRKQFFEEVRIMQKLHHIHVVEILNSYSRGKTSSILLLPLADMDLGDFIEILQAGEMAEEEREEKTVLLCQWIKCLAEGLRYIHSSNVKHKDIKPQNLLVHKNNILYTDFGIARDFEGNVSVTAGNTGMTRRYSAPEVVAGDARSRPADLFSLGCVYVEMLETILQRSIFEDFDMEDDYATYVQDNRSRIKGKLDAATEITSESRHTRDTISPELSILTFKMLAISPQDRPKASQLVEQLCTKSPEGVLLPCCHRVISVV